MFDFGRHAVAPNLHQCVSVRSRPEANPVKLYLDSLEKYGDLPADCLVLRSHGKTLPKVCTNVSRNYINITRNVLDEVLRACTPALSAHDIVPIMFKRELDAHQLTFALGEALAHYHYLWFEGKLKRELGADEVYRFVAR